VTELQTLDPLAIIAAGERTVLVFGAFALVFVVVLVRAVVKFVLGGWRQPFSGSDGSSGSDGD
jgi:hypothetical protein